MKDIAIEKSETRFLYFLKMDEKTYAASSSVLAAVFLTIIKLIVGIWSGSLGILSEALHSALDLAAAGMTLFAVRSSGRPSDQDHQFGHGKIESLAALFETVLLLITVIWIIYEAIRRIMVSELEIITHPITFGVVILAIIIDYSRSRLLYKMADRYDSQALKADALHFSTDILSSSVVFVGLILTMFGFPLGDPFAAIGVAIIVLYMTISLGKETIDSLLDRAPRGDKEKVQEAAEKVEGVISCGKIRLRKSGPTTFVDLSIVIDPNILLETAHEIGEKVIIEIQKVINSADVSIHMDPASEDLTPLIRFIRKESERYEWLKDIHRIFAFEFIGNISIGLHIKVAAEKTLGEIHELIDPFKQEILRKDSRILENFLNLHVEPYVEEAQFQLDRENLRKRIQILTEETEIFSDLHGIQIFPIPNGIFVSFHCKAAPNLTIDEVHRVSNILEEKISREIPTNSQFYIYVEAKMAE
ncbi:MAG: cation diffusion facilitator family transporter [Candidatus Hodarchaeota archaeon]